MDKGSTQTVIEAAGGLVWRQSPEGKELVLIHRPRYGDWTLPKGKRKKNESWQDTALREVKEETGCEVLLGDFAGSVSYSVDGIPKVVLYWNMDLVGECKPRQSDELDQLLWLPASRAIKKLDYKGEKAMIADGLQTTNRTSNVLTKLRSRLPFWLRWSSVSHQRLEASLETYRTEIDHLYTETEGDLKPVPPWRNAISILLDKAQAAVDDGRVDEGWRCFMAAQRMEVFGLAKLNAPSFRARAHATLNEANRKLDSWRKETVEDILSNKGELKRDLEPLSVYFATTILHEHHSNVYQRLNILRRQQGTLILLCLFSLLAATVFILPNLGSGIEINNKILLFGVLLFGVMGASVSGTLSLAGGASNKRIPEQILSSWITLARPVVGGVAALALFSFVLSGFFQAEEVSLSLIFAVSFASGFSERLLARAVAAVQ